MDSKTEALKAELNRVAVETAEKVVNKHLSEKGLPEEKPDTFDLESVYDEEIFPLMSQIIAICKKHKMPMLASFCYAKGKDDPSDPEGLDYCTTSLPRDKWLPPELDEALRIVRRTSRAQTMMFTVGPRK
jgi:hypothetical protein